MNLAIDIGNSRIKLGLFEAGKMVEKLVWDTWRPEALLDLATNQGVKNIIFSSVAKVLPPPVELQMREQFFLLLLNNQTPLPFKNQYRTPHTLGIDRLAAVAGAQALFPGINCLVIDAGTCITYEMLTAQGEYLGGNIAPGIRLRLQAMHTFTARLPEVHQGPTEHWIGYSTESAMQNGAQWGLSFEIEGAIEQFSAHFAPLQVILTGGDAEFLAEMMKSKIFVHSDLVLIGLNKILTHNVEHVA